ncbi:hypothetical protein LFL96_05470 [Paraburkholderia sp. D15]|uniref:hypothetical protein n=1 Tax=Paraburkholderia sp. D15 TaxID=2880218 RepID=UPI00247ADAC6|nr:hypothetical protein [Paraburkholderia sp. D15]WGS50953.1 hypothetical protein LFL96_05470 [Paraburkholderia sp. D15]
MQHAKNAGVQRLAESIGKRWKSILVISVLGAVVGVAGSTLVPKRWPARVLVQVGQTENGTPLVDPAGLVERIKFPSFATQVITSMGLPGDDEDPRVKLFKKTLWANVPRGGSLIEIHVNGYSPQEAKNNAIAALALIQKDHEALLAPAIDRKQKLLTQYEQQLKEHLDQRSAILSRLQSKSGADNSHGSQDIVFSILIQSDGFETRALTEQIARLRDQLDTTRMFNTKAVAPVYVRDRPDSLSAGACSVFGLLAGLAVSLAWLLIKDASLRMSFYGAVVGRTGRTGRAIG